MPGISYAKTTIAAFLSRQLGLAAQPESVRFRAAESCASSPNRVSGPTSIRFLHFNAVADHVSCRNLSGGPHAAGFCCDGVALGGGQNFSVFRSQKTVRNRVHYFSEFPQFVL